MKRRNDIRAIAAYRDVHTGLLMALNGMHELTYALEGRMPVHNTVLAKVAVRVCKAMRTLVTFQVDNELETHEHVLEVFKYDTNVINNPTVTGPVTTSQENDNDHQ